MHENSSQWKGKTKRDAWTGWVVTGIPFTCHPASEKKRFVRPDVVPVLGRIGTYYREN